MSRTVTLVLCSPTGELLGTLAPFELPVPFRQESADVVAEAESRFGARVTVLRLLHAEQSRPGGRVAYLAELGPGAFNAELSPVSAQLRDRAERPSSKRMPWAELGGPARSIEWARSALGHGEASSFRAVQQRTWNLSTLWRLESPSEAEPPIWLKQVPHFMRHESTVLRWLNGAAPGAAPILRAADDNGRSLLAHVPGTDLYGAPVAMRQLINEQLHVIQSVGAEAIEELLALGIPDLRGPKRAADIRLKLLAWAPDYPALDVLLQKLDERLAALEDCGLPATLVHADNHPGNARGTPENVRLLDWGEAFIGNPVTDLLGLIGGLSREEAVPLIESWCASWKRVAPDSSPERALELAPFVGAMHGAATFAHFLHEIEETEWPYHSEDVPRCLEAASALLRVESV
jgi:hypothetical protein